ncbi:MAG: TetM/TetW/TetO/TetS family tetracycline resistance ribosomal protection protein [Lachnospiraceae bacterium]|nr:TetM/TetW/TetO/TetS family tetracycline resistance ribosomal protection protein [Lachnospiraceae bacterium]
MKKIVIGMLAHVDAGKTTLSEALLFHAGVLRRMGRVDRRDTFFDTRATERERGITIFSKQAVLPFADCSFTLLDTPGHVDFSPETERTMSVLDYAVLVISGADGVQNHTETLWNLLSHYRIPTVLFVNKMDQPGTDEQTLLASLKKKLSDSIVNMTHPDDEDLSLLSEEMLQEYLENGTVQRSHFPSLIRERRMFPCFFGSALRDSGVDIFLEALKELTLMPETQEAFGARVYKITYDSDNTRLTHMKITGGTLSAKETIEEAGKADRIRIYSGEKFTVVPTVSAGDLCAVTGLTDSRAGDVYGSAKDSAATVLEPVLSYRLRPKNMDSVKLLPLIRRLEEEDPSLHVLWEEAVKEIHIQVMGTVQLEILTRELHDRFGAEVAFDTGSIVYRETIADTVEGVGHFEPLRHYAEVHLVLSPLPAGSGLTFQTALSEDLLSGNWQRLILTHLAEKRHRGVLTGSFLTDVSITLVAGKAHPKHTEGGDFRQATYRAVRQGLMQAENVLLEPFYSFRITLPEESIGRVMHELDTMYASFHREDDTADGEAVLCGSAPVSAFRDFPAELPAFTKGRGRITWQVDGYRPCHNADEVIAAMHYDPEADLRNPSGSVFCTHGSGYPVAWYEVPQHMHLPFVLRPEGIEEETVNFSAPDVRSRMEAMDLALGTEEIDRIIQRSGHANERADKKMPVKKPAPKPYRGTETKHLNGPEWVLVDGYNIIHAWPELAELANVNLDSARGKLLDQLSNYAAFRGCELIAVFDAYRLIGHAEEYFDYHNIHVVFTKEAETADRYIERFTHQHAGDYRIRVATSDGMEQIIIRGAGSLVVSAREFLAEVNAAEQDILEHI